MRSLSVMAAALAIATGVEAANVTAADEGGGQGLEEVIVTAQKREENIQRAALAVTAVTSDALDRAGVVDAAALTRVVPALQISNAFATSSTFYLRGVGNSVFNSFTDSAVSFNVDGLYVAHVSSTSGMFFDLDRVEVLKGPQGTLYGRNSTGGAINIITAKPKIGELSGNAALEFGNYDLRKFDGAINLPVGTSSAVRIAGQAIDRSGFYDDGTGDDVEQAIRLTYLLSAEKFKLTAGVTYQHAGGVGAGTTLLGLDPENRIGITSAAAGALFASTPTFASIGLGTLFLHPISRADIRNNDKNWGGYVQADIETPAGTLTILPSFSHADLDYSNPAAGFLIGSLQDDNTASVEARLVSDSSGRLNYIIGAYYYHDDIEEISGFNQDSRAFYVNFQPEVNSYAAYGRLTFEIKDDLRLTGGVRYTSDDKTATYSSINALVACFAPAVCSTPAFPAGARAPAFIFDYATRQVVPFQFWGQGALIGLFQERGDLSKRFDKTNYRVGIEYDVAPDSMAYATFETGFKSGGFFVSVDDPTFKPEEIAAFTLGSKNRFLDNRLQVNVELYDWVYKDQQFSHFRINSQGAPEFVTENIGKTHFQGAELEVQARALRNTAVSGTVQYNSSKNKKFTYQSPVPVATGCPVSVGAVFTIDCTGFRAPHAPLWTLMAGLEQRIPLGGAGDLTFNADWRYQSESYQNIELTPDELQGGYYTADVSLSYATANNHFWGSLFVNNAFDRVAAGFIQPNLSQSFIPSVYSMNLIAPRTYGVRLGYKY